MATTREYADRTGAVIGTLGGIALGSYLFALDNFSDYVINGENYGKNTTIKVTCFLLTVGLCANLGRNEAIGLHDSIKLVVQGSKKAYVSIKKCYNRQINPNLNPGQEVRDVEMAMEAT